MDIEKHPSCILTQCSIATMQNHSYGLIADGALVMDDGKIAWVGERTTLPEDYQSLPRHELGGKLITPALIDCHTHLVYGGNRAQEFEMRLQGKSYAEIAQSGGGIVSTMRETRNTDEEGLIASALPRLDSLLAEGVAVVEIKSGYGLTIADEMKMLRAARKLEQLRPVKIVTSWLAAHAIPPEYQTSADAYIDEIAIAGLYQAHEQGLVDAVDGFCEKIAFTASQIERVFQAAQSLGLPLKLHAEQLSHQGGTQLAARYGARSVEHIEYINEQDVQMMAEKGCVATLLPGAFYTLHETQAPPIAALRKAGVPMALASDANPGSSPLFSLLLTLNMGCTLFGLTPEEALLGVTSHAAKALGLEQSHGTIQANMPANLAIWHSQHPCELAYHISYNPLYARIHQGDWFTRSIYEEKQS